jgi:hypothetical protein
MVGFFCWPHMCICTVLLSSSPLSVLSFLFLPSSYPCYLRSLCLSLHFHYSLRVCDENPSGFLSGKIRDFKNNVHTRWSGNRPEFSFLKIIVQLIFYNISILIAVSLKLCLDSLFCPISCHFS